MWKQFILLLFMVGTVLTLTAFDCSGSNDRQFYSITHSPQCPLPPVKITKEKTFLGSLIQMEQKVRTPAQYCKLTRISPTYYCTYHKHLSPLIHTSTYAKPVNVQISGEQCEQLHDDKEIIVDGLKLSKKSIVAGVWIPHQHNDKSGFCAEWSSDVTVPVYFVEVGKTTITLWLDDMGSVERITHDGSVVIGDIDKGVGSVLDKTSFSWDPLPPSYCPLKLVKQGVITKVIGDDDDVVYMMDEITAAFTEVVTQFICGTSVIQMSDPSIFIDTDLAHHYKPVDPSTTPRWSSVIMTGTQYFSTASTLELAEDLTIIMRDLCQLETQIFQEIIYSSRSDGPSAAYRLYQELGWSLEVSGAVVQVVKCLEIEVVINPQEECYTEIPIQSDAHSWYKFMDPLTRTLSASASKISCTDHLVPSFSIDNRWYKLTPSLSVISPPQRLESRLKNSPGPVLRTYKGLYPKEVLNTMDTQLGFQERQELVEEHLRSFTDPNVGNAAPNYPNFITDSTGFMTYASNQVMTGLNTTWLIALTSAVALLYYRLLRRAVTPHNPAILQPIFGNVP